MVMVMVMVMVILTRNSGAADGTGGRERGDKRENRHVTLRMWQLHTCLRILTYSESDT